MTTCLDHPYDIEYDYTSRFPISFRGCFVCGATDYFGTNKCPVEIKGKVEKRLFFNEMWAHKPHTKRKNQKEIPVCNL